MEGFDNDGKVTSLDTVRPPIEDLVPWSQDPLRRKNILYLPFILTQSQGEGGGSGIGNLEEIQQSRDIHLQTRIPIDTFTQVEDHVGTYLLQPVDHGEDFITNGHHIALMTEGLDRLLYCSNILDDGLLSHEILLLPFLESFKKIVENSHP